MIVFDLRCVAGHRFEGWFASSSDFEGQKARGLLSCPSCGVGGVERALSAPRINVGAPAPKAAERAPEMAGKDPIAIAQMLYSRMLDEILAKSEDVGRDFPAEARKVFYNEAPPRLIRGEATLQEEQELLDEGILVARLAVPGRDQLN